jgi:hypothetical protein
MYMSWSSRWHHVLYNLNWTRVSCSFMHLNEYATIAAWVKACKEPLFIIQKMSSYKLAYNVINHSRTKTADIKWFVLVLHIGDCQKDLQQNWINEMHMQIRPWITPQLRVQTNCCWKKVWYNSTIHISSIWLVKFPTRPFARNKLLRQCI